MIDIFIYCSNMIRAEEQAVVRKECAAIVFCCEAALYCPNL